MGYSILIIDIPSYSGIGNRDAGLMSLKDFNNDESLVISHPDAPSFPNDPTENTNLRSPSYSGWRDFCQDLDLYDLFFNTEDGLMRNHPGWFEFGMGHLEIVQNARAAYQKKYPDVEPGWGPYVESGWGANLPCSGNMARVLWLEWWMKYALENFTHPGIYNS